MRDPSWVARTASSALRPYADERQPVERRAGLGAAELGEQRVDAVAATCVGQLELGERATAPLGGTATASDLDPGVRG